MQTNKLALLLIASLASGASSFCAAQEIYPYDTSIGWVIPMLPADRCSKLDQYIDSRKDEYGWGNLSDARKKEILHKVDLCNYWDAKCLSWLRANWSDIVRIKPVMCAMSLDTSLGDPVRRNANYDFLSANCGNPDAQKRWFADESGKTGDGSWAEIDPRSDATGTGNAGAAPFTKDIK